MRVRERKPRPMQNPEASERFSAVVRGREKDIWPESVWIKFPLRSRDACYTFYSLRVFLLVK